MLTNSQLPTSPRPHSTRSINPHPPGPYHSGANQYHDWILCESAARDVGSLDCHCVYNPVTTSHGRHQTSMAILVHGIRRTAVPASVHQHPVHRWPAHHIFCVSLAHPGFRRRSVQYLRATWHLNWLDGHSSHHRISHGQLKGSRQVIPGSSDGWISRGLLDLVRHDGCGRSYRSVGIAPGREDWCEARLI